MWWIAPIFSLLVEEKEKEGKKGIYQEILTVTLTVWLEIILHTLSLSSPSQEIL